VAVPAPLTPASAQGCARLTALLPQRLESLPRRATTPTSPLVAAWGASAVVLRCGVARPPGFTAGSQTTVVNGLAWFQVVGTRSVTWTALGRSAYVELRIPQSEPADAFLVDLGSVIARALPAAR